MTKTEEENFSLRDKFAMAAMHGIISCGEWCYLKKEEDAKLAYQIADYMLEARKN